MRPRRSACLPLALAASASLSLAVHAAWAAPITVAPASALNSPSIPNTAAHNGVLYLEVVINGISTEQVAQFFLVGGALYTRPDELGKVGILAGRIPADAQGRVALAAIPGLTYAYRPELQRIDLQVADAQRVPNVFGEASLRRTPTATAGAHGWPRPSAWAVYPRRSA